MLRTLIALLLLTPALAIAECDEDIAFLAQLIAQDPVELARGAAARGDFQFLGVGAPELSVPGVDSGRCTARRERVRAIDGTGVAGCGPAATKLQPAAAQFARRYNEVLKLQLDGQETRYTICR